MQLFPVIDILVRLRQAKSGASTHHIGQIRSSRRRECLHVASPAVVTSEDVVIRAYSAACIMALILLMRT